MKALAHPLRTPRLILREIESSDFGPIFAFASDPEIAEFSTWGPLSEFEMRAWFNEVVSFQSEEPRTNWELAITHAESKDVIGTCRLGIQSGDDREGYIGYTLRPSEWGKGFATEAARELVRHGFEALDLRRIHATSSPLHLASHRVLEKIGMKHEKLLPKHVLQRGDWRDSALFAIHRD